MTCVFENTQTATVIIDKETVPEAGSAVFDFQWFLPNSEFGEAFTLTDTQEPKVFAGLNPDQDWGNTEMAETAGGSWASDASRAANRSTAPRRTERRRS